MVMRAGQKLTAAELGQLSSTAQYQQTSNMTIPTSSNQFVSFAQNNRTTAFVTKQTSGSGHTFTLNKSGLWAITASVRFDPAGTNSRQAWIEGPGGFRYNTAAMPASATSPSTMPLATCQWFDSGTTIAVTVFQDSGGNVTLLAGANTAEGRIDLVYIMGEA